MASRVLVCLLVGFSLCLLKIKTCETTQTCGTQFELEVGNIHSFSSPGFPELYPSGVQCRWKVRSPENTIINLRCPVFHVDISPFGCLDTFYATGASYKGDGLNNPLCGNLTKLNLNTTNNHLDVYFTSFGAYNASYKEGTGFLCNITVFMKSSHEKEVVSNCGMKSILSRIVNGENASVHAWPWQVALIVMKKEKIQPHQQHCGGSLISANWVLTAAHCVEGRTKDDLFVALGDHDLETELETHHTVKQFLRDIIVHFGYMKGKGNAMINDIALLQLKEPVKFSNGIFPVCLPINSRNSLFDGVDATVTGWGTLESGGSPSPNDLLEVTLPIITNTECSDMYGIDIYDDQICAYEEGKDSCQGDSGGPLVWGDKEHRYHQIGIVSWGKGCAMKDKPGVYTRVSCYIDWIEEITHTNYSYYHDEYNNQMTQSNN